MSKLTDALAAAKAARAESKPAGPVRTAASADEPDFSAAIPQVYRDGDEVDPDTEAEKLISQIGILEAYDRWCGKTKSPKVDRNGEYIVSCPMPGHRDSNPSARLDPANNRWNCWGCGTNVGGGVMQIAAAHFGFEMVPKDRRFHELRMKMLMSMGHEFRQDARSGVWKLIVETPQAPPTKAAPKPKPAPAEPTPGEMMFETEQAVVDAETERADAMLNADFFADTIGTTKANPLPPTQRVKPPVAEQPVKKAEKAPEQPKEEPKPVPEQIPAKKAENPPISAKKAPKSTYTGSDQLEKLKALGDEYEPGTFRDPDPLNPVPELPFDEIIGPNSTFLRTYMDFACRDASAPEWHFWSALQAVGFAGGRDTWVDGKPVYGNLFVCFTGAAGEGKSLAQGYLSTLIQNAFPLDPENQDSDGAKVAEGIGSGEALVKAFQHSVMAMMPAKSGKTEKGGSGMPILEERELIGTNVKVLALFEEFSTIKAKASSESSTLRDKLITMYDGSALSTRVTKESTRIEAPFGSVSTTTQPGRLGKLIAKDEVLGGFVSRWIFAPGRVKNPYHLYEDVQGYDVRVLVPDLQKLEIWSKGRGKLPFTPEAARLWKGYFAQQVLPYKTGDAGEADAKARVDLTCKKLMLLLAIDEQSPQITEDIVVRTMRCWDYLTESLEFLLGAMAETELGQIEKEIMAAISEHFERREGEGPSMRDLRRKFKNKDWVSSDVLPRTIDRLCAAGEIERLAKSGGRGPATDRYFLVE